MDRAAVAASRSPDCTEVGTGARAALLLQLVDAEARVVPRREDGGGDAGTGARASAVSRASVKSWTVVGGRASAVAAPRSGR